MIEAKKLIMAATLLFCCGTIYPAIPAPKVRRIPMSELEDKIAGAWIGQMIGNIYGLPHENKYVDAPGPENWPYGYSKNLDKLKQYGGAFSDDDTDLEYMYLLQMEKSGPEPAYSDLRDAWMYHIRDRVWLANRGALGLMHYGYTPPYTGNKEINPHWYQIDPQLINEIWAFTAPGMTTYAASKSEWAARITSDDWGTEPTIHYGAMYAAAFFETDIRKLIDIGLSHLPSGSRYAQTVRDMIALHARYPGQWQLAWKEMAQKYYLNEPDMTRTIWNANLNGACAILAMLYGEGDFGKTLDLSCAMGFDADNQAATVAGLMGVMYGFSKLPKELYLPINGWTLPFNDRYINITRYDLPDAGIQDIIDRTVDISLKLILSKGGKITGSGEKKMVHINTNAGFNPPPEFYIGPLPFMEVGKPVEHTFYTSANRNYIWKLHKGTLPEGIVFDKGRITGTPVNAGVYPVVLELYGLGKTIQREFILHVHSENIALKADSVIANVRTLNDAVLDSCWYTFGKSLYAKSVDVINDGKISGPGSVFYSLAAKARLPKVDYYGYYWHNARTTNQIALFTGGMEEFGGWFTSLNVQYLDDDGMWTAVKNQNITPALPAHSPVFFQPHYARYFISFDPVTTKGIRIIGDAVVQDHWNKYTRYVSSFTSVCELCVFSYEP